MILMSAVWCSSCIPRPPCLQQYWRLLVCRMSMRSTSACRNRYLGRAKHMGAYKEQPARRVACAPLHILLALVLCAIKVLIRAKAHA